MVAPFSFSPSQAWDGNDGSWSTFIVRVGTPAQDFRVLISTAGQETWVPVPEGCTSSDPVNCASTRGVLPSNGVDSAGFKNNQSSTWTEIDLSNLDMETGLGYGGNGEYGFDTVGLQIENSGGLTLDHQVVAGIADKDFYLGIFGLGPKPANFSNFDHPEPAFMPTLKENGLIPSLTYGYTAGAPYRLQKVLGSLTLGGYDASRLNITNLTLPLGADDSRTLVVGVQSIEVSGALHGDAQVLGSEGQVVALIDSTVPHLWIPQSACDAFQKAFNLTYDNSTDLYLMDDDTHTELVKTAPSISITLSSGLDDRDAQTLTIILPFAAFDLQASYPIYPNATRYFPIRKAANDTQYTLGRTFLQEAYIIVDYERSRFSVHQAAFHDPMPAQDIVALAAANESLTGNATTSSTTKSKSLDSAEIAGTVVGALVGSVVVVWLLWWLLTWRKRRLITDGPEYTSVELTDDKAEGPMELSTRAKIQQAEDSSRHELSGSETRLGELSAGNVHHRFLKGAPAATPELPGLPSSAGPHRTPTPRYELPQ